MKSFKTLLFVFALISIATSCNIESEESVVNRILKNNIEELNTSEQVLIVYNHEEGDFKAKLFALEKKDAKWDFKFGPIDANIGRNGFAPEGEKREGDGKSPSGIFKLGKLFTYEQSVPTLMPFQQSTKEDKWIDDADSDDYNKYVRGETDAKSYENLILENDVYKYCMVIEYNTNPIVKGAGSAIFFHLKGDSESTAGCIAIDEENMLEILKWMNPDATPMIIMGSTNKKGLEISVKKMEYEDGVLNSETIELNEKDR